MTKGIIYFLIFSAIGLTNCNQFGSTETTCYVGSGISKTEERIPGSFESLEVEGNIDIYFSRGEEQKVIIEAEDNLIEHIETKIKNNRLSIKLEGCTGNKLPVKIDVVTTTIKDVYLHGRGNLFTKDTLQGQEINIILNDSFNADIIIQTDRIVPTLLGSGKMIVHGKTKIQSIGIKASSTYESLDLSCETADISLEGSGDCKVMVNKKIDVYISGSGSLFYKGEAQVAPLIVGSGKVNKLN